MKKQSFIIKFVPTEGDVITTVGDALWIPFNRILSDHDLQINGGKEEFNQML